MGSNYDFHRIINSKYLDEFDSLLLPLKDEVMLVQGRKHATTAVWRECNFVLLPHDDMTAVVDTGEGALREEDELRWIQAVVVMCGKDYG